MQKFIVAIVVVFYSFLSFNMLFAADMIWQQSGLQTGQITSIAINPSNTNILYAGTWGGGVYKSINGGVNWSTVNTGLPYTSGTYVIRMDPSNPNTLYVGATEIGIYKSTNGATSWNPINTGLTRLNIHMAPVIDPINPLKLYVGTEAEVFKSTNGGASWSTANNGLGDDHEICALAIDSSNSSIIYAGSIYEAGYNDGGVSKSTDGGANWSPVNTGLPSNTGAAAINTLIIDPANSQIIYAGSNGGGVYKSVNGGTSWSPMNSGLTNLTVYGMAIDPSSSSTIYVATFGDGVFKSTDGGANWQTLNIGLTNKSVIPLVYDPSSVATLYAGTYGGGVFKTATCTTTLTPSSYAFSASSNTGTITVTSSSSSCTWTATSNAAWITITAGGSGTGNGTVSYSVAANSTNSIRTGTITAGGQTFTITQAAWAYTNSVGFRNSIKVTDMSGSLPSAGGNISVKAWDISGNVLTESSSAASLTLYSNGTTTISGADLIARFPYGTPILYAISADSSKYIITNVMISADGTLNIPNGYASDTTKFITNCVGGRNAIKITDMSGTLSASGAAITVTAWDANGVALTESSSATPLILYNHGTTTIAGTDLQARFPSAIPMSYEFTVASSKYVIVNVKSSADGSINIPYAFTSGSTKFVANSIGSRNNIRITDMSGTLSATGAAITVSAWDVNGNALAESGSAAPLLLYSHGTTTISGTNLMARFPSAIPMAYEFTVNATKYLITNTKSSTDGTITIPFVYTSGTSNYVINSVSNRNTLKITDVSGLLSSTGAAITVSAWDVNGNALAESGSAAALKLYNNGTTTITGSELMARFPTGSPVSYEFTIGSTQYDITNLVANTDGTINVPSVYSSGVAGGI